MARLCDVEQWPIEAVRYASAALSSIAVSPDMKVRAACAPSCAHQHRDVLGIRTPRPVSC